ncbi:MobV family relaxase [Desulfovibrio sp.]|uniref:MobV family relaxase n=1 Tax=Desulfovibrio sp. TaxID=885 RepID=UPI0030788037
MSYLVLHMDKFKKEAVRGIQSHNRRERESHSNPDIDYGRSAGNYDLHESPTANYAEAIQNRIDDLLLVKAVRKDAVHMCGLIVSSDKAFFDKLTPEETRCFFEESKAFLTDFVGKENVISAMVHMDEKTPHMHFLHVPVTPDGRLNANSIYTRASLKKLQNDLPRYLQSKGFNIQRGVEQKPGSAKKHLDTREFKQQQEALANIRQESDRIAHNALQLIGEMGERRKQEAVLQERLDAYEQQAQEAEKILAEMPELPQASVFNYKSVLSTAKLIIEQQQKALAAKRGISAKNEKLKEELSAQKEEISRQQEANTSLHREIAQLKAEKKAEAERSGTEVRKWYKLFEEANERLKFLTLFFHQKPEAEAMHREFVVEQERKAAQKAERIRLMQERELEKAREREEERQRQIQREAERPSQGWTMRMR